MEQVERKELEQVKKAAGYIRVSTVEQSLKGLSIETQIAEIKAYAEYHKMKLEDIYIDRGITARKSLSKRVDFMRMMHDVEAGKIDHIIVLRLDRFFRNIYDYHRMMNEYLLPNNCDWSAVKEQYTTETTNGRLMINLRLSIAEQECDTDSDRIKDVLDHRAKEGYAITGAQPFGLKIENKRVVVDEEKRHIAKDIFNQMELLNSARKAMTYLNQTYNTKFTYGNFRRIIKNPLYYGCYRGVENYCEAIITKEQFENVQRILGINVRKRKNSYTYIFSGLMICAHCGRRMSGNHSTSGRSDGRVYHYASYRCNKSVLDDQCDNNLSISSANVEKFMVENVERLIKERICAVEAEERESKPQKANRKSIEQKMLRLNDLYVNGFIDMEKYKADYAALQDQIIDPPKKQKTDLTAIKKFLQGNCLKTTYPALSDIEKQALWRTIIKEIRVSGKSIVGVVFL